MNSEQARLVSHFIKFSRDVYGDLSYNKNFNQVQYAMTLCANVGYETDRDWQSMITAVMIDVPFFGEISNKQSLLEIGVPYRSAEAIMILQKEVSQTMEEYFKAVASNEIAYKVKCEDIKLNIELHGKTNDVTYKNLNLSLESLRKLHESNIVRPAIAA